MREVCSSSSWEVSREMNRAIPDEVAVLVIVIAGSEESKWLCVRINSSHH